MSVTVYVDHKGMGPAAEIQDMSRFLRMMGRGFKPASTAGARRTGSKIRQSLKQRIKRGWDGGIPLSKTTKLLYQQGMPGQGSTTSERSDGSTPQREYHNIAPGGKDIPKYAGHKKGWHRSGAMANSVHLVRAQGGAYMVTIFGRGPQGQNLHYIAAGLERGWSRQIYFSKASRRYLAILFKQHGGYKKGTKGNKKLVRVPPRPVFAATYRKTRGYMIGWFMQGFANFFRKGFVKGNPFSKQGKYYVHQVISNLQTVGGGKVQGKMGGPDFEDMQPW